jgi:hypothetical protein
MMPSSIAVIVVIFNRIIMICYEMIWAFGFIARDRIRSHVA